MVVSHVESLDLKIWHKLGFQMSMIQDGLRDQSFTSLMTDLCQDINRDSLAGSKYKSSTTALTERTFFIPWGHLLSAKSSTFMSWRRWAFNEVNDWTLTQAGIVSKLYVYPIKSLNGLAVSKAKVEQHGLSFDDFMDRQFMIIDEKSNFVTGRQYPKLSLIQVIPRSNGFILKANGMDDFYLDLPISESSSKELVQTMVCIGGYVEINE